MLTPSPPSAPMASHLSLGAFTLHRSWTDPQVNDDLSGGTVAAQIMLAGGASSVVSLIAITNDAYPSHHGLPPQLRQYTLPPPGEDVSTIRPTRVVDLVGFDDTEGVALVSTAADGSITLAVTEERRLDLGIITLPPLSPTGADGVQRLSISRTDAASRILPLGITPQSLGNKGAEGVAYDAAEGALYALIEKGPMRILRVDMASGQITEPFDAQSVLSPAGASDLAGVYFDPVYRNLIFLSQEASLLVQTTLDGQLIDTLHVAGEQPEGIAISPDQRSLYVISEPNQIFEYIRQDR